MRRIIFSGKGGAGKTTIFSLVLHFILQRFTDKRVLVIDADPAANLLQSLGIDNPDIQPIGKLDSLVPQNWDEYSDSFFNSSKTHHITTLNYDGTKFDYGFMGHHEKNSCLCSYNNALNYMLRHLNKTQEYDYVFMDREAGVEHINRSVYGNENDRLIVVAWPTSEYLMVAKEINDLADILGSTKHRLLVINNTQGINFNEEDLRDLLKSFNLDGKTYVIMPKLRTFEGLQKLQAKKIAELMDENQKQSILAILDFMIS